MKTLILGDHDDNTLQQMAEAVDDERVVASALMADGHFGFGMPVGGVIAYDNAVSPEGVGVDIGCGNKAVRTNLRAIDVKPDLGGIMDRVFSEIAFGQGQSKGVDRDDSVFDRGEWSLPQAAELKDLARQQLGSVGGGNHYVDIMEADDGALWVGVHFGSRGFGFKLAKQFMSKDESVTVIGLDTPRGSDYWALMELAGAYAYAGRDAVCRQVLQILGAEETHAVHNHHNYAWKETHFGQEVIVVRKGATPAFPGQAGFVGGSMGDDAVLLEGASEPGINGAVLQQAALYSTVHGAGRTMSRTAAKGKWKKGVQVRPGAVSVEAMREWIEARDLVLRGADLDEAPQAYRRLHEVLVAQGPTIEITNTLRPIGVAMAGPRDFDPYKD